MLDPQQSRQRQRRLLALLEETKLDAVAVGHWRHVYYFSSHLTHWLHQSGLVLLKEGTCWLTASNKPVQNLAVDESTSFEAQWLATLRQEQPAVVAQQMAEFLRKQGARRIGIDASEVSSQLLTGNEFELLPIDETLHQLRRRKDLDELALINGAIACTEKMFERAREIVRAGVTELDVFNELHAAAVREAGEPLTTYLGNDFTCGGGGGPPRADRAAREGELYILDLGPCYRGYFADACRTFAVSEPTEVQRRACEAVRSCFELIEKLARPGARCRDIYDTVIQHLKQTAGRAFDHHLGHGIGLQPHEFPHFNPKWDDVLMEGEVFAIEPALYGPELRSGIRIENNYLVTAAGVERLSHTPMNL